MNGLPQTAGARPGAWRQLLALVRLETARIALRGRTLPVYVLAAAPPGVAMMIATIVVLLPSVQIAEDARALPLLFASLFMLELRFCLYLACLWLFMNLFRGEMIDRSLHFYFLTPVRRELLVAGKFLSGLAVAWVAFVGSTVATYLVLHLSLRGGIASGELLGGSTGLGRYVLTTMLACVGYGALFLVLGLFLRNPVVPALLVWGWEFLNQLLPQALKFLSVIYWLEAVHVIRVDESDFATVGRLVSPWVSVPGILAVALVLTAVAAWRARRLEIDYSAE